MPARSRNFLAVYGHVALDYIVSVERLPKPNTFVEIFEERRYFGGTGGNLARLAGALGVPTALAAFVGERFPEDYRAVLEDVGVDLSDLIAVPGEQTPAVWMLSDPKGNQVGFTNQAAMRGADRRPLLTHALETSEIVHVGTGRWKTALRILAAARAKGKQLTFDPAQEIHYVWSRAILPRALRALDYFFSNEEELRVALHYLGCRRPTDLLERTRVLVTTQGRRGSRILTAEERHVIGSVRPRRIVDPTGAGDGYRAGMYAGLARGLELELCGWFGAAAAAFALEGVGAQAVVPTWEAVLGRLPARIRHRIEDHAVWAQARPSS